MSAPAQAQTSPRPALLGSLIAVMVAAWTLNFLVVKVGLRHLPALTLASFRLVLAGCLMLPVYALYRRSSRTAPRPRLARADYWTLARLGLLGVAINQMCFTVGLNYTTVGHSALVLAMGPVLILLLAWAQGLEALTARKVLGMALAFAGTLVLAAEHGLSFRSATLLGDLITFAGSISYSLYTVLGKKVAEQYDAVTMNAFNYFTAALLILPLALHQAVRLPASGGWGGVGWQGWAALAYMAAFASVVSYLIYFWALRYLSASRLGAFSYLHPVLTTLLGVGLLGEQLTRHLLAGGALVLVGVYAVESGPREPQLKANQSGA